MLQGLCYDSPNSEMRQHFITGHMDRSYCWGSLTNVGIWKLKFGMFLSCVAKCKLWREQKYTVSVKNCHLTPGRWQARHIPRPGFKPDHW